MSLITTQTEQSDSFGERSANLTAAQLWKTTLQIKQELNSLWAKSAGRREFRREASKTYRLEAIAYSQLRDFGEIFQNHENVSTHPLLDDVENFFLRNYQYRRKSYLHNLSYALCTDPVAFQRNAYRIVRRAVPKEYHRDISLAIECTVTSVQPLLVQVLPLIPSEIVRDKGLEKFGRTYLGVVYCYFVLRRSAQTPVVPVESLCLRAYSLALAFLLCDCAFDTSSLVGKSHREHFCEVLKGALDNTVGNEIVGVPSDLFKVARDQWAQQLCKHMNKDILLSLRNAIDAQFSPRENARLHSDPTVEELLRSSAIQASISREAVLLMVGCEVTADMRRKLRVAGLVNQLSNDIEGAYKDEDNQRTLFSIVMPYPRALEIYFRSACEQVNSLPVSQRWLACRCIALRTLEAFKELELEQGKGSVRKALEVWSSGCSDFSPLHELEVVAKEPENAFRIHRENVLVNNVAGGLARYRARERRKFTVGKRIVLRCQDACSFPLSAELAKYDGTEAGKYAIRGDGKRVRSLIFLATCKMLVESSKNYGFAEYAVATAIEYFHTASLIFDDLPCQDNDERRRERPAAHIAYSEAEAQLAGLEMIAKGFRALSAAENTSGRQGLVRLASRYFSGTSGVIRGQLDDLKSKSSPFKSKQEYLKTIIRKTGLGFQFPVDAAILLNGGSESIVQLAPITVRNIGTLYQIRDDILDGDAVGVEVGDLKLLEDLIDGRIKQSLSRFDSKPLAETFSYFAIKASPNAQL